MKKNATTKNKLALEKVVVKNLTVRSGMQAGARCQNTCFNCGRSSMISHSG